MMVELCPYTRLYWFVSCSWGKCDFAAYTFGCEHEIDRAAYLMRDEIADKVGAVARSLAPQGRVSVTWAGGSNGRLSEGIGNCNQRATHLPLLNHSMLRRRFPEIRRRPRR